MAMAVAMSMGDSTISDGNGKKDVEDTLPHRQVEGVEYLTV